MRRRMRQVATAAVKASWKLAWVSVAVIVAALLSLVGAGTASAVVAPKPVAVHRLSGSVYEYDYLIRTGSGPYDRVGVHRVVRVRHRRPIAAPNGVFLVHGDDWNFDAAFVGGPSSSQSVAVYLASKGMDVWGIDLDWTLVPKGASDLSFMRGWGLQHNVDEVKTGLGFARSVRALTGSSADKLTLMAWSRGGWIGYALLNEESQRRDHRRQVRAFIPVDTFFKVNDAATRARMCSFERSTEKHIKRGIYAEHNGVVARLGKLAQQHPNAPSPLFGPPYTNLQASLDYGAATFQGGASFSPFYHFVGGIFPDNNIKKIPTGLKYTRVSRWNAFLASGSQFEPTTLVRDTFAITCSPGPTGKFDDHLGDVTVPILYVGAGGGFGRAGLYSLTLLGSRDVSSHIVSFYPPSKAAFDFGHVDLFHARHARQLVWRPIYNWLARHAPPANLRAGIARDSGSLARR